MSLIIEVDPPADPNAWKITCHEAGHAVAGVRLNIPYSHVERGQGENGQVSGLGVNPIESQDRDWTQNEISCWQQFYAAGAAAEQLLFDSYRSNASSHDRGLHDLMENHWNKNRTGGWECDIQAAMKVLDRESVEKVAKELDRQKKLSFDRVCQLLGCTQPW